MMTRDEMIDYLVDADYTYIMECANGPELLDSYLKFGFKGYMEFSTEELIAEVKEREAMKQ